MFIQKVMSIVSPASAITKQAIHPQVRLNMAAMRKLIALSSMDVSTPTRLVVLSDVTIVVLLVCKSSH